MAPTLRRRAPRPQSTTPASRSRSRRKDQAYVTTKPSKNIKTKPQPKKKKTKVPSRISEPGEDMEWSWTPPKNPQATFDGLPAELRLLIYEYLCDSTIIHVHRRDDEEKSGPVRFTWTFCRGANPNYPLLCANPKWSGLCKEEDRCTYKLRGPPPEPRGFAALTATCKLYRQEGQEFFLRETVISIHQDNVWLWLDFLQRTSPQQLKYIRRVTILSTGSYNFTGIRLLAQQVPNLEAFGLQSQDPWYRWMSGNTSKTSTVGTWTRHNFLPIIQHTMKPTVTVALESFLWRSHRHTANPEQAVVRIIREGKDMPYVPLSPDRPFYDGFRSIYPGWTDDDVRMETYIPGHIVEWKRNAKWRQWWRTKQFSWY